MRLSKASIASLIALALATTLAACASQPPAPDYPPPPPRKLDAKTQLENGR